MTELEEAIQAVSTLNERLEKHGEQFCSEYMFNLTTDLCGFVISLNETTLWHSYDEDREFFEEKNEYEDLSTHCLHKLRQHTDALISILN